MKCQRCKTREVPVDAIFAICDDCFDAWDKEFNEKMRAGSLSEADAALFIPPDGYKVGVGADGRGVLVKDQGNA